MGDMMDPNMWGMNPYYGQRMPGGMMHGQMHMQMPMQVKRPGDPGPMDKKADKPDKAKELPKEMKKETKYLEMLNFPIAMQIIQSLQFSVNAARSVLTVNTIKKLLKELDEKCKEKKLKSTSKEIMDFLSDYEVKPSKDEHEHKVTHHHAKKISELELIEAMSQVKQYS